MGILYFLLIILLATVFCIFVFNYIFYKYFVDPTEAYGLAAFTITITMSIGLLCVLLIPLDVFLINYKGIPEIVGYRDSLQLTFYLLYGILLFVAFFLIPFTYFYGEERLEDGYLNTSTKEKLCNSLKYTLFFIVFCLVLMISGLYFKNVDINNNKNFGDQWVKVLFDTDNKGEQAVSFVISIFSVIGMVFLIFYTGYGLAALPFFLIKGTKSISSTHKEYELDKSQIREKIRNLQEKLTKRGSLSQKEKRDLAKFREDEQNLDKKITKISGLMESADGILNYLLIIFTPFRVIIGIVFLSLSILIFASLFITSLDRFLHSNCGLNCGFVLMTNLYPNYIDMIFNYLAKWFYLDYILFFIINVYVFICTIYGLVNLGVKFFCFTVFMIKKRSTLPQGLLVFSFMVSISILAFMMEISTLAPQYSTFGPQTFINPKDNKVTPCNLSSFTSDKQKSCIMSNTSKFYNRISISLPFFSTIFYFANCVLILVLFFSIIYAALCKEDNEIDDYTDVEDEDEERAVLHSSKV